MDTDLDLIYAESLESLRSATSTAARGTRSQGEDVQAPVREVELHSVTVDLVAPTELTLSLHCGKGFYVRSLARDLARALGTRGHVKALRRTASGPFDLQRALYGDGLTAEAIAERLIPLREACGALRRAGGDGRRLRRRRRRWRHGRGHRGKFPVAQISVNSIRRAPETVDHQFFSGDRMFGRGILRHRQAHAEQRDHSNERAFLH